MKHIKFPKMPRFFSQVTITEKIDGTNALIAINDDCTEIKAGSRNKWLTLEADHQGFCRWVCDNKEELLKLGPGYHYGEWWGQGIQRGYGLKEKRFSLFNTKEWNKENKPSCCHVVPILAKADEGDSLFHKITIACDVLKGYGSMATPGYMNPEGIVLYFKKAGQYFKIPFNK